MAHQRIRGQIEAHWRTFDALADAQSAGNEAIIRALDLFKGARGAFTQAAEASPGSYMFGGLQPEVGWASPMFSPRGTANTDAVDNGARAYFRAEEALVLAHEQLARNEEILRQMSEEVDRARASLNSCYNTEEVAGREEFRDAQARASLQVLDRGDSGCAMTPVDMVRAMTGLLRMHQSEVEMQENFVSGLGYETPEETVTAYREALGLRPFLDEGYLSQVQEIRELSQELEQPGAGV